MIGGEDSVAEQLVSSSLSQVAQLLFGTRCPLSSLRLALYGQHRACAGGS